MECIPKCPIKSLSVGDVLKGQDGKKYIVCKKVDTMYWEPYLENVSNNRSVPVSNQKRETCTCTVCFEEITDEKTTSYFPCNHALHQGCCTEYIKHAIQARKNISCPVCRQEHFTYGHRNYEFIRSELGL